MMFVCLMKLLHSMHLVKVTVTQYNLFLCIQLWITLHCCSYLYEQYLFHYFNFKLDFSFVTDNTVHHNFNGKKHKLLLFIDGSYFVLTQLFLLYFNYNTWSYDDLQLIKILLLTTVAKVRVTTLCSCKTKLYTYWFILDVIVSQFQAVYRKFQVITIMSIKNVMVCTLYCN